MEAKPTAAARVDKTKRRMKKSVRAELRKAARPKVLAASQHVRISPQ
jgi:hypothetical protein